MTLSEKIPDSVTPRIRDIAAYFSRSGGTRALTVGGTFSDAPRDKKKSYFVSTMANCLGAPGFFESAGISGGSLQDLDDILKYILPVVDILVWAPNICNKEMEDKYLPSIKKMNPRVLLVSTKRMDGRDIIPNDLVGLALKSKANLIIGIHMSKAPMLRKNLLMDPLGNLFYEGRNPAKLGRSLATRLLFLIEAERAGSMKIDPIFSIPAYEDDGFLNIVKSFGTRFSKFVDQVNPTRLLGNASTRCTKGFPSCRAEPDKNSFFVSRRNVDKETLSEKDMVYVEGFDKKVQYMGNNKPSVDTPIQAKLYEKYPWVNYIIHGHSYVDKVALDIEGESQILTWGVPLPSSNGFKFPCGDLREFNFICRIMEAYTKAYNLTFTDKFAVLNLPGHGCIIMSSKLKYFENIHLRARPFPEGATIIDI